MKKIIISIILLFICSSVYNQYSIAQPLHEKIYEKLSSAESKFHNMRLEWSKGWDLTDVENLIKRAKSEIKSGRIRLAEGYLDKAIRIMESLELRYNSSHITLKNTPPLLDNDKLTRLVAVRTIERGIIGYSWGQTIAMKGLLATGNWGYVKAIVDRYIEKDIKPKNVNDCAIGDVLLTLYEMFKDERYLKKAKEIGDFILSYRDRLPSGGIVHEPGSRQLWIDTVYMICPFLVRMGEPYREEGLKQLDVHIKYLMNPNIYLFHHAWDENTFSLTPHYWARGNGWMLATLVEIFPYLEEGERSYYESIIKFMIKTLIKFQDKSGLWHTLINMKDTYLETSGSLLLGYGINKAISLGIVDESYKDVIDKLLSGLKNRISKDGDVLGVSEGTGPGDYIYYAKRKTGIFPHGQGAVLLFLGGLK